MAPKSTGSTQAKTSARTKSDDRRKRNQEPGRQRRVTGDPSEMPKALRETRLRQRY
jgi:hypothetical protein